MGRLKIVLNLVILAIGAFIAWHEFHHPPATKPESSPEPAPPKASPPKTPSAAAPEPEETAAAKAAPAPPPKPPAPADTPSPEASVAPAADDAGDTAGVDDAEERAAARISELADDPPVPDNAVAGDGSHECPEAFPIKGNATSRIYHEPGRPSYERTIAEFCFATAEAAEAAGFRAPRH